MAESGEGGDGDINVCSSAAAPPLVQQTAESTQSNEVGLNSVGSNTTEDGGGGVAAAFAASAAASGGAVSDTAQSTTNDAREQNRFLEAVRGLFWGIFIVCTLTTAWCCARYIRRTKGESSSVRRKVETISGKEKKSRIELAGNWIGILGSIATIISTAVIFTRDPGVTLAVEADEFTASTLNRDPIFLHVLVTRSDNNDRVTGLDIEGFTIRSLREHKSWSFSVCELAGCFEGTDIYRLKINRAAEGNWRLGLHFGEMQVHTKFGSGSTFFDFDIPAQPLFTPSPTSFPSLSPSSLPTISPMTLLPTTVSPTEFPSISSQTPSMMLEPTREEPTREPAMTPHTEGGEPSSSPTELPTRPPTGLPTDSPTRMPTQLPTNPSACSKKPCFRGVSCSDLPSGSFICGDCPTDFKGDGIDCIRYREVFKYPTAFAHADGYEILSTKPTPQRIWADSTKMELPNALAFCRGKGYSAVEIFFDGCDGKAYTAYLDWVPVQSMRPVTRPTYGWKPRLSGPASMGVMNKGICYELFQVIICINYDTQ